jgi:hypothetical protein
MCRHAGRLGVVGAALAVVVAGSSIHAQGAPTVSIVVERLGAYLADYAERLPAIIASEHYVQRAGTGVTKDQVTLDSDFGMVRLPGISEWLGFRQVLQKNGQPVADGARRLETLFFNPASQRLEQALLIAEESARHNIGQIARTVNSPALVLELLDGRNAGRLRFTKNGEDVVEGMKTWVMRFQEVARPTIVRSTGQSDVPAGGKAWVDPATGTLIRAEVKITTQPPEPYFSGTTDVSFRLEPKLGFWVPATMNEQYVSRRFVAVSSGLAVYSNYRRFAVDTRESLGPQP